MTRPIDADTQKTERAVSEFSETLDSVMLKPLDCQFGAQLQSAMKTDDVIAFIHHRGVCAGIAIAARHFGFFDGEGLLNIIDSLMSMKFPDDKEAANADGA